MSTLRSYWLGISAVMFMCASRATGQSLPILPDHVYQPYIKTVLLSPPGNPTGYPILSLNGSDQLLLSFDDLQADVKNYSYRIILCNADWKPAPLAAFDYLKGFNENRLENYSYSTMALQRYTHYQLLLPNSNCVPTRAGNYILEVFQDGNPGVPVLTRRFLVTSNQAIIDGHIQQPATPALFHTGQKISFTVDVKGLNITNIIDQVKVFVLQNYRWDNAIHDVQPTFIRGELLEYNSEEHFIFPASKEWRWIDMRSFRLQTERVNHIVTMRDGTDVYLQNDMVRANQPYVYHKDYNGRYIPGLLEPNYNPDVDGDYALVHFTLQVTAPFAGSHIYMYGELSNYQCDSTDEMEYQPNLHAYTGTLYLKQGYYDYMYAVKTSPEAVPDLGVIEGNWWETENDYTILVYYRPIGGRADQLIAVRTLNSMQNR